MMANMIDMEDNMVKIQLKVVPERTTDAPKE